MERRDRWIATITAVIVSPTVFNSEWKNAKDCLNRLIEAELTEIWHEYFATGLKGTDSYECYYSSPYANQLDGYIKKVEKDLKKAQSHHHVLGVETLGKLIAKAIELKAYADPLMALKPNIVKGRKPDPNKKTPLRTLTNTGTCGVCGQNVKRGRFGKLVHHGYQRPGDGSLYGQCFGTDYPPIELSNVVLYSYVEQLKKWLHGKKSLLESYKDMATNSVQTIQSSFRTMVRDNVHPYGTTLRSHVPLVVSRGNPLFDQVLKEETNRVEAEIRSLENEIKMRLQQIDDWVEKELPR